jgi:hypothetical protein
MKEPQEPINAVDTTLTEEPMPDSRLKEHVKKQTLRNVLLVIGGLIVLGVIIVAFGTQILINFSLLLRGSDQNQNQPTHDTTNSSYIEPPVLDPIPVATNNSTVTVKGYANPKHTINLYINGKLAKKTTVKSNKSFTFQSVTLTSGDNEIKAKAVNEDDKQSDFSNTIKVAYSNKAPSLTLDSPQDGQSFKKDASPIKVSGKTDAGIRVTVNDFWAIVDDNGNYSYDYPLKDGENKIKVAATDDAGNKTEKEITIKTE